MRTESTFLKKALPGGCKSWQRCSFEQRSRSEKKPQRASKIIRRTKRLSDWLISSARLRTGKHPENIDVSDIFSWSTYVSHKYMLSFLSSLSELHVVSKWLFTWYRNDFHFNSGMSFVPECSSYFIHKIERLSLRRSRSRGVFAPDQVQMRHLPQATRFAIFNPERSLFSVYMIPEWNFLDQEREFHSQWKPEWIRAWVSSDPSWIND